MNKSIFIFAALISCFTLCAQEAEVLPECVHKDQSILIFPGDRSAQDAFYEKLDSLVAGGEESVNVWQVGGSHVQGGFFPRRIMNSFFVTVPEGERGFIFPRTLANTHAESGYKIYAEGNWDAPMLTRRSETPKPRYGITGFSARTDSLASVGFNTNPYRKKTWFFDKVRILGYASSESAYPEMVCDGETYTATYEEETETYLFEFPEQTDTAVINFIVPEGESFVLSGIQPLSGKKGLNFFASGVNGASVPSWADQCADLERDLKLVNPDLVIFGLGINDSACPPDKFDPERFKKAYRRLISKIQSVSPDCAMIFITNNDSYRYVRGGMEYNQNAEAVRTAMMELAEEYGAGVWDLYAVMGGAESVLSWVEAKLVSKDKLHFTKDGYNLIGDLLFEAIMNDWTNSNEL